MKIWKFYSQKGITKILSIFIISIIVTAFFVGYIYFFFISNPIASSSIKIGVCADLDTLIGQSSWEGIVLAAEEINSKGGVIGRNLEIIGEDSDGSTPNSDIMTGTTALNKLITVHNVDFIISPDSAFMLTYQDIVSDHKKILFAISGLSNDFTQRVLDDYDQYKYFFRIQPNATHALLGLSDCLVTLRDYTDFNKLAILVQDTNTWNGLLTVLSDHLPGVHGFEIVYQNNFPPNTIDFSSYFSAIETSGAEILVPLTGSQEDIALVKEWHDRQSPFVLWGFGPFVSDPSGWERTEGKCEFTTMVGYPTTAGYPMTSQTLPMREAYIDRWGTIPNYYASLGYDTLRFILNSAIENAGTIETDAVISSLEEIKVETSLAKNFVFSSSHDVLGGENINNPEEELMVVMLYQWQNETQVPMYPKTTKEEAGATYTYPPWPGPWD